MAKVAVTGITIAGATTADITSADPVTINPAKQRRMKCDTCQRRESSDFQYF
jgi:hypothetical protein